MTQIHTRKIRLFEMLQTEKNYRPASYFSQILGVSEKTIYNDVVELNQEMKSFQLEIVKAPRKGLMLVGDFSNIEKFEQMLKEQNELVIVNYSPAFRRLKLLEFLLLRSSCDPIEKLEERFCVTSASLYNDIKEIQSIFTHYDVHIFQANGYFKCEGLESNIQKALNQYLMITLENDFSCSLDIQNDSFKMLIEAVFDPTIVLLVYDAINSLMEQMKRAISDYYATSLFITILILVSRIRLNHHISNDETMIFENLSVFEPYLMAVEIAQQFEKRISLVFEEDDIRSLSERLFVHRIEPSLKGDILNAKYCRVIDDMIYKMSALLDIDLCEDNHLRDSLLYHIPPMIFRLKKNYMVKNPLLNEIKKQYMVLFTLTWYASSILEQEYDITLNDDEVSFLLIHFQVAIDKKYIQKNVVIVCDNGIATSELMLNRIMQILPYKDNIRTATKKELLNSDLSNVDFVITSIDLPKIDAEVIRVNTLMTQEDISKIMAHYSQLNTKISSLRNTSSISDEDFNRYFKDELIFINKEVNSKEECLNYLIKQYEDLNLVTPSFRNMIFKREAMGITSLGTGVAIPHASCETVLETKMAIMTCNKKVKWNDANEVDVIVVFGISEKDTKKMKNLIARILELVDDAQSVDELRQVKNSREMRSLLRKLI